MADSVKVKSSFASSSHCDRIPFAEMAGYETGLPICPAEKIAAKVGLRV
jgi:hypothetical protein